MEQNPPGGRKTTPKAIDALRPLAEQRGKEHAAGEEAFDARVTVEVDLLEYLIEAVAPGLPAICGNIHVGYERRREANAQRTPVEKHLVYELQGEAVRGIHVAGLRAPKSQPKQAPQGRLEGEGLWLLEDGRLLELAFSGSFDVSAPVDMAWTATPTVVTTEDAIEDGYSIDAIFEAVHEGLAKHERGRAIRREQARAEQVGAILTLLRMVPPPAPEDAQARGPRGQRR